MTLAPVVGIAYPAAATGPSPAPLPSWTTNGTVNAVAQSGTTTFLGGDFTYVGPPTGVAAIVDQNGVPRSTWPQVHGGAVTAVVSDGVGGWYIGGSFTTVAQLDIPRLAHIKPDNTVDTSFVPVPNDAVSALALVGSTLYVGGHFTRMGAATRNYVAAVETTAGSVTAWNPSANFSVSDLLVAGSVVYAAGYFTTIGGQARSHVAALDATTGAATSWNPNADNTVHTLALSGTTLYVGGQFTAIGGQPRNRAAALDTVTGAANGWNPNANSIVWKLALAGTSVYMGGGFTTIGAQTRRFIAEVDTSAGTASAWNPDADNVVFNLAVGASAVYAVGEFFSIGGQTRWHVASLSRDAAAGGRATSWEANADAAGTTIALSGTDVFLGGVFSSVGGKLRNRLAAIDNTTGMVTSWNPNANHDVLAMALSGSTLYVGGSFLSIGEQSRNYLAALDVTTGAVSGFNPNPSSTVRTLAVSGATVYAGGFFTTIGGQPRNFLAALDGATGAATGWNPNVTGGTASVQALTVTPTAVYAGGFFAAVGGQPRSNIAAIDPATGQPTSWDANASNGVLALASSGTRVYAGGSFTSIGGQSRSRVAALDASTGAADSTWNPGADGTVQTIVPEGATVFLGGGFYTVGGQSHRHLAAVDANSGAADGAWNPTLTGPNSEVETVKALALSSSSVAVGGSFRAASGVARRGFALFPRPTTPPTLAVGDVKITEGDTGARVAYFPISLSAPSTSPVTVNYRTANGTAEQPADYTATSGTLTFAAGQVNKVVGVVIKGDTADEDNHNFTLRLSTAENATIADGVGIGTIRDDDVESGRSITISDVTGREGNSGGPRTFDFTVSLSGAASSTVKVNFATANGIAAAPSDYTARTGTVTFEPGIVSQRVRVTTKADALTEPNESFSVRLSAPTGPAAITDAVGIGTLVNDDG